MKRAFKIVTPKRMINPDNYRDMRVSYCTDENKQFNSMNVGFNSHSYFTSSFKKQFGKTPTEYINELKLKEKTTNI